MKPFVFCCLVMATLAARSAAAQTSPRDKPAESLESYIRAHADNGDFSGVVLVTRKGQLIYEGGFGLASQSSELANSPDTRFLTASVTKTFTAAGILLLQDEGKLKITDGLELYLPDFAPASRIKLWHLLAHQSGLANPDYEMIAARNVSPDELLAMIAAKALRFEPGSRSSYSNAGYIVLARVIEKVSGQRFDEFLQQRIFARLAMAGSGTVRSGVVVPRLAEGHVPGVGTELLKAPASDPSALYGSGNVYSTARDLDRWLRAVERAELFDITKQAYPFGWGKREWFEKDVLVQSGIASGYSSIILTVPQEELHIVVLMNTQSGFTGDEGKTLLGIVLGHPAPVPPKRPAPAAVGRGVLERHAGLYHWGEGKVPMHIETDGEVLTLRWADSTSSVRLTPLSESEFLDRTSFGVIRFEEAGLVWIQNGEQTPAVRG